MSCFAKKNILHHIFPASLSLSFFIYFPLFCLFSRSFREHHRTSTNIIMKLNNRMGYNGRDCVLQALCESSTMFDTKKRRTMIQEMIKTVFTMPKSKVLSSEHPELLIYDEAFRHGRKEMNCEDLYRACNFSLIKLILGKYSKAPFVGFM